MINLMWLLIIVSLSSFFGWSLLKLMRGGASVDERTSFMYCVILPVCFSAVMYALVY